MTIICGTAALAAKINSGELVATAIVNVWSGPYPIKNAAGGGKAWEFGSITPSLEYQAGDNGNFSTNVNRLFVEIPSRFSSAPKNVRVNTWLEADVGTASAAALIATGLFAAGGNLNKPFLTTPPEVNNLP